MVNKKWDEKRIKAQLIDDLIRKNQNKSIICSEVPLLGGKRWVDILEIKKDSLIAYEIKSDLDSIIKLQEQLDDYIGAFNEIYVVLSNKFIGKHTNLPKHVGYFVIEPDEGKIILKRKSKKKIHLSKKKISYFLWKPDMPIHLRKYKKSMDFIRNKLIKNSTTQSLQKLAIQALTRRYSDRFKLFLQEKSKKTHFSEISVLTKKEIHIY